MRGGLCFQRGWHSFWCSAEGCIKRAGSCVVRYLCLLRFCQSRNHIAGPQTLWGPGSRNSSALPPRFSLGNANRRQTTVNLQSSRPLGRKTPGSRTVDAEVLSFQGFQGFGPQGTNPGRCHCAWTLGPAPHSERGATA